MDLKKICKALLFPHVAVLIILLPVATAFLVCSMVFLGTESIISIISYVLASYTLTVWCARIPDIIRLVKAFKNENKYIIRWQSDTRLRVKVSLYASIIINAIYAVFHLWLGIYHRTFWFSSLGAYYVCLSAMRYYLLGHTKKYAPGEKRENELKKYRACGIVFLIMNIALSLIVFFMLYWNRTFTHHMITTIAMAAYTFTAFTLAIINVIKFKKYNSPVYSASKAISFAAVCVSMLTLTSTMLTTFSDGTMSELENKMMLAGVGFAVVGVVLAMAIRMIVKGTRELKTINTEVNNAE